ncbi:hypothetical protein Tco_0588052 [Tanacetum coccineum]
MLEYTDCHHAYVMSRKSKEKKEFDVELCTIIRGDDEEVLTNEELSDLEEENLSEGDEIAEIFKIETNIFDFETPLCEAFKEFNYLLKIDIDVLTKDIHVSKTYEEYKDEWIYQWNKGIP